MGKEVLEKSYVAVLGCLHGKNEDELINRFMDMVLSSGFKLLDKPRVVRDIVNPIPPTGDTSLRSSNANNYKIRVEAAVEVPK